MRADLPPGQHAIDGLPRWGLPQFLKRRFALPETFVVTIGGAVTTSIVLDEAVCAAVPRCERVTSLHCVTTWTRDGLRFAGWSLRALWDVVIVPQAQPDPRVCAVVVRGLDGCWTMLPLEDLLAPDVLVADRLDDRPLGRAHGAPLRLVVPAHYGYKQVKHVCALELLTEWPARRTLVWFEHPRARVAFEERGPYVPGWVYRTVYRAALPLMQRALSHTEGNDALVNREPKPSAQKDD